MGKYVTENIIKELIKADVSKNAKVAVLGFTFKENCPDTRNTRVIDIYNELNEYGIKPLIIDPQADEEEALREYGLTFDKMSDVRDMDAIIVAVSHDEFKSLSEDDFDRLFKKDQTKIKC